MTLFEVGISLLIVGVSVTTVLMLFPVGLKAQQESRYRIIAASQAQKLVQGVLERQQMLVFGSEGEQEWDQPYASPTVLAPDIDGGINLRRGGDTWELWSSYAPLPPKILERIDSDNDEMARLAAEGSPVFYAIRDGSDMKLVFAMSGLPQQNALLYHPQIRWPYHDFYPSGFVDGWRGVEDTEVRVLYAMDNTRGLFNAVASRDHLQMRAALLTLGLDVVALDLPVASQIALDAEYAVDPMRFNARAVVLRFYAFASGIAATRSGLAQFWPNRVFPDSNREIRDFQVAHAWMLAYIGYLQLRQPYDLRTPRNSAMSTMADAPLFQFDLTTPLRDPGAGTGLMFAWPVMAGQSVASTGGNLNGSEDTWVPVAPGYAPWPVSSTRLESTGWNLTAPFAPSERCRAITVWAVDWQGYEDFESVPGAPVDSGMVPRMPRSNSGTVWGASQGPVVCSWAIDCMSPEFPWAWKGRDHVLTVLTDGGEPEQNYCQGPSYRNTLPSYLSRHGCDRNRNGVFDRGPVRASTRMRATTIARFLAYDPRLYLQLR